MPTSRQALVPLVGFLALQVACADEIQGVGDSGSGTTDGALSEIPDGPMVVDVALPVVLVVNQVVSCGAACTVYLRTPCLPNSCPFSSLAWYGPVGHSSDGTPLYDGYLYDCDQVPAWTKPGPSGPVPFDQNWCCCDSEILP